MTDNSFLMPDKDEHIHHKYFIKEGDTFKSVSEELGIDWQTIRFYHNTHCIADEDVINADFPKHLKFLLLKPVKLQANAKSKVVPLKAKLNNGFNVSFLTINGKFGVISTILNGTNEHTLKYEVSLKWIATDKNGYSFYEINRLSKIYIDD